MITMRLMRYGAKKRPSYRIVVMESKRSCQSETIDVVGSYDPLKEPPDIKIDQERAKRWLAKGVQPSRTVLSLLDRTSKPKTTTD
ncbi:MAG: 30S ribosomal protein S16 [Candidatus Aminicenantes bacterium]|nr:30S ribosomal protein S16 [Candidatus Aminicenantes bacterium]